MQKVLACLPIRCRPLLPVLESIAFINFQINVVEHTRVLPKFIDNEDAGLYSIIFSNSSNGSTIKVAGQVYSEVHNGRHTVCFMMTT